MSLEAALRGVLAKDVAVACAPLDAEHPPLFPAEVAAMAKARPARRQEFTAGRACARLALSALGEPAVAVPVGKDRRPLWPEGIVGSIAHKAGWAASVAGRAAGYAGLGLDLETAEPLPAALAVEVCKPEGWAEGCTVEMPDGRRLDRGKLVFSAKECLFKAYYPAAGYFLDFPEAQVTFAPAAGVFEAALVSANAPSLAGRRTFQGCFGMVGGLVFAAMAVPA